MPIAGMPFVQNGMDAFNRNFGFDNLMKQILERKHLSQQKELQEIANAMREREFKSNFDLRQQAENRASQLFPLQLQAMRDAHMRASPDYESHQLQSMIDTFGGLENIKNNPILRGLVKHKYGFDPLGDNEVYQGPAREAHDLERLRQEVGEDSPVYQNALALHNSKIGSQKDLADLRARTKSGLRPGEKEFFDEKTGEPLGKEIPLTEKERESEEGNYLFNELYPHVYNGAYRFSGEGSISRLEKAAANYKTDPKARKSFDDLLLSDKMLAATTVNEASTLKAGRTNRTYNMLKESLEAQDIPKIIKKLIKEYKIPASAQLKASMRYQKILSDARKKAHGSVPATRRLYYNPDMQPKEEPVKEQKKSDQVIVIDPNGKKFETTEENAAHLPQGWKRG